jgi:hypothetical protein
LNCSVGAIQPRADCLKSGSGSEPTWAAATVDTTNHRYSVAAFQLDEPSSCLPRAYAAHRSNILGEHPAALTE